MLQSSPGGGGGLPGPGGVLLAGGVSPWSRWGGGVLPAGGSAWSVGVCLVRGGLPGLGGSPWSQGGFSLVPGGLLAGGFSPGGLLGPGGGLPGRGGVLRRPPLWTESQTRVKT